MFSALQNTTVDTCDSLQSTAPLPNFTHFPREEGLGVIIFTFPPHQAVRSTRNFNAGLWLHGEVFVFSAMLGATDTRSCVSLRRLSRISYIFYVKMDSGRLSWTLLYVRLVSGSQLSVSVSPEITSSQFASSMQMLGLTVVHLGETSSLPPLDDLRRHVILDADALFDDAYFAFLSSCLLVTLCH